ncbi:alcohol acetyltransferase [Trametes elegans]|nr:alcohol acetyltransferase [Trametes elegans]
MARYEGGGGRLTRSTLFCALEEVVREHAELAARLRADEPGSKPSWYRLQSINFDRIVEFLDVNSRKLESVLEAQFLRSFDVNVDLPLWSLSVLTDATVIFAYDHALGDGQSGLGFHLSLLAALRKVKESPEHSGVVLLANNTAPMLPPVEDAMDVSASLPRILHEVWKAIDPLSRLKRDTTWTGNPVPPEFKFDTNVRILQLSPEETARLVRLSRAHDTTVTGTLYALVAHALSRLLPESPKTRHYKSLSVLIPVSLRRYTGAPPTAICDHVSIYQTKCPLPASPRPNTKPEADPLADFPWAAAARLSHALKRAVPRTPATVGVMKALLRKHERFLRGGLGKKRETTVEISNLGPVAPSPRAIAGDAGGDAAGRWEIKETLFAQADGTLGGALKVNVAGSPSGGMGIALTWGKEAMDGAFAESLVEAFTRGLDGLLLSSRA